MTSLILSDSENLSRHWTAYLLPGQLWAIWALIFAAGFVGGYMARYLI